MLHVRYFSARLRTVGGLGDRGADAAIAVDVTTITQDEVGSLRRWRATGEGPPFYVLGPHGEIYYHLEELVQWLEQVEAQFNVRPPRRVRKRA